MVAIADAVLLAKSTKSANVGGDMILMGGQTSQVGSALVSASAQVDPNVLEITVGGNIVLQSGVGGGTAARIQNEGDITIKIAGNAPYTYTDTVEGVKTIPKGGFIIIGNSSSGIFNGQNTPIEGNELPILISLTGGGSITRITDNGRGTSLMQSGVKPFDTSLLNYLIFAANEETQTTRVSAGIGGSDDANLPACN